MSSQLSEDEVERAYLRDFLFGNPPRQLGTEDSGTALYELQRRLEAWLRMVSATPFELTGGSPSGTDLQRIFVPPALPLPVRSRSDAALYRVMGLIQLGLIEHGFLHDRALLGELYRDWTLRSTYHLLAAQWILQHYIRRFPGIENDLRRVSAMESAGKLRVNLTEVPRDGIPNAFTPLYDGLTIGLNWNTDSPDGLAAERAVDAVRQTPEPAGALLVVSGQARRLRDEFMSRRLGPPPLPEVVGLIRPEWILGEEARQQEAGQDWREGQLPLRRLKQAIKDRKAAAIGSRLREKIRQKMALPPEESIRDMPAYGPARDAARAAAVQTKERRFTPSADVSSFTQGGGEDLPDSEGQAHHEWDASRGAYRIAAVRVLSPAANSGPLENYQRICEQQRREIALVRRRFAALRVEERWVGRQPDGPELDMASAIRAYCDIHAGKEPAQEIYRKFIRQRRDLCVMTLVDLSGSTKGSVLYEQQRAIVLFAEALSTLDLPHAFYGFNGTGAQDCRLSRIKGFDEHYEDPVLRRLGNLRAEGGTRLGAHIREASRLLALRPQARRLLLLLSDGKPEERGEYRGRYGVRDSEMAVAEGRPNGIQVHCISLDPAEEAPTYLTRIFGPGRF
ncbi:MAG: hypothetical protein VXW32_08160, partial [Myxococcota bacterium]|nr:hypothetical protein [Myxococcota bacterium]